MWSDSNKPYLHNASRMQRLLVWLNLADDSQVSDEGLCSTLVALGFIVLFLSLSGCATPTSQVRSVEGKSYILHLDHDDNPCGNRGWQNGCYVQRGDYHAIYMSSIAPSHVLPHEEAHRLGMRHAEWMNGCTVITVGLLPRYPLGAKICIRNNEEYVES